MAQGTTLTVTFRVSRFKPMPQGTVSARRSSSPFGNTRRSSSPFGTKRESSSPFGAKKVSSSPFSSSTAATPRHQQARGKKWVQEYTIEASAHDTILNCLLRIKRDIDPTLAFRYSCGHGMCGSDAAAINGTPMLLCTTTIGKFVEDHTVISENTASHASLSADGFRKTSASVQAVNNTHGTATVNDEIDHPVELPESITLSITPLPGFPVLKDLISDIEPMLDQIRRLKPFLQRIGELKTTEEGKIDAFEYLQSPEQLAVYEKLTTCIACGVCEGACPVFTGGEAFVGPAALVSSIRFMNDSRDNAYQSRLENLSDSDGLTACQSVRACGLKCPQGIDVGEVIWQAIQLVPRNR